MAQQTTELTDLIRNIDWQNSKQLETLYQNLYDQLKKMALIHLSKNKASDTLSATALVNESFITMSKQANLKPENTQHFLALTSKAMRYCLLDFYKMKSSYKRSGHVVELDHADFDSTTNDYEFDQLHEAINTMEQINPKLAQLVDLRFFWGMTLEEVAALKNQKTSHIYQQWKLAKSMLHNLLTETDQS